MADRNKNQNSSDRNRGRQSEERGSKRSIGNQKGTTQTGASNQGGQHKAKDDNVYRNSGITRDNA